MRTVGSFLVAVLVALVVSACGGGGSGSGSGSSGTVASTLSFTLKDALAAWVSAGESTNLAVSGTCSGTAYMYSSTPTAAVFEGASGYSTFSTLSINFSNCQPTNIYSASTEYFNSDFTPHGVVVSGGDYSVNETPLNIPATVKVGDSGVIGTQINYADATKAVVTGRDEVTYVVEADTANSAIISLNIQSFDTSGVLLGTEQHRYRITETGMLVRVSSDVVSVPNSMHLVMTVIPDTTAPTVLSTTPLNSTTDVLTTASVSATLSEPMDFATINGSSFTLSSASGTTAGTVTLDNTGKIATFTPSSILSGNTLYTAQITTAAKDLAGLPISSNYSWSFTTVVPDTTAPTVVTTNPVAQATISIDSPISVDFSEAMDPTSVTSTEIVLMNGTAPVTGTVTYSGVTATFKSSAPLAYDTLYTASISTGVKDAAGNVMIAPYTWSFRTDKAINLLGFNVIDAEYSKSMDRIVMVSAAPANQLHIYDPVNNTDTVVSLNLVPTSVSVSPDGLFAVVGHNAWMSYVDLSTGSLLNIWPVTSDMIDVVFAGNGYAYAFPATGQWTQPHAINLATGAEAIGTGMSIYSGTKAKLQPGGTAIYGANNGLTPADIEKYDITTAGASSYLYNSPYHGDYAMCGDLWISEDGLRIFTRCGNVFNATNLQATDMLYGGALQNLTLIRALDHSSAIGKVIAIPDNNYFGPTDLDTRVQIFSYSFLTYDQTISLPHFSSGGVPYAGHGRFVFYNSTGTQAFVVLQAASGSGMTYDYGVVTY